MTNLDKTSKNRVEQTSAKAQIDKYRAPDNPIQKINYRLHVIFPVCMNVMITL